MIACIGRPWDLLQSLFSFLPPPASFKSATNCAKKRRGKKHKKIKKKMNKGFPKRKNIHLKNVDYSVPGAPLWLVI